MGISVNHVLLFNHKIAQKVTYKLKFMTLILCMYSVAILFFSQVCICSWQNNYSMK